MQKYTDEFIKKVVDVYVNDPVITQRELATKFNVPYPVVVSWLRSKQHGLTQFQRYKRSRDKAIRQSWDVYNGKIKSIREKKIQAKQTYKQKIQAIRQKRNEVAKSYSQKVKEIRQARNHIGEAYNLTPDTVRQLIYRKEVNN